MATKNKLPRHDSSKQKKHGTDLGPESKTIPGEARSVQELFNLYAVGQPLPQARQPINLPPINKILEDHYDLPDIEKYIQSDMVDRNEIIERVRALKSHLDAEFSAYKDSISRAEEIVQEKAGNEVEAKK